MVRTLVPYLSHRRCHASQALDVVDIAANLLIARPWNSDLTFPFRLGALTLTAYYVQLAPPWPGPSKEGKADAAHGNPSGTMVHLAFVDRET